MDDMVRAIGPLQPRGAGTRRSWYDWQERPETISLLTGLAAIQVLGPEASMEVLFGDAATSSSASRDELEGRMVQMEQRFEVLAGLVEKLQEAMETQRKLLAQLASRLNPAENPVNEGTRP